MTANPAQLRYLADAVSTATPAQRVVMLYDRLLLDLRRAMQSGSGEVRDRHAASQPLRHAQQIIAELLSSLQPGQWSGADNLRSIYHFVLAELVAANAQLEVDRLESVHTMLAGLRDSWSAVSVSAPAVALDPGAGSAAAPAVAWVG